MTIDGRSPLPLPPDTAAALAAVSRDHARALSAAAKAGDARAIAVNQARAAGATWGQLAAILGITRASCQDLVARGASLAAAVPGTPTAPLALSVTAANTPEPPAGPVCLRDGCDATTSGGRFCSLHLYA